MITRLSCLGAIVFLWLASLSNAHGQGFMTVTDGKVVTPNFTPASKKTATTTPAGPGAAVVPAVQVTPGSAGTQTPATTVIPTTQVVPNGIRQVQAKMPQARPQDEGADIFVRTELPGPQRLFTRESESQFYDRIRHEVKKQPGAGPAIFPEEAPISKGWHSRPTYPRIDPADKQPFRPMVETVEPSYVCHRRLLFEQPNFERLGYDFGILQSGLHLGVFYYDLAMCPYHYWSDLKNRAECSAGKCLPGDPAPFTVPIERFSVTGVIGEAGAIIGGLYLFPH